MPNSNYLVHVTCPHCEFKTIVAISGFGGELAIRTKECKRCGKEFFVHLLAETSIEKEISDSEVCAMRDRIKMLKEKRKGTYAELLIKHEVLRDAYQHALDIASEMRDRSNEN